jgi:hypothetical protein
MTCLIGRKHGKKKQKFRLWRQKFMAGLRAVGLDIEEVREYTHNSTKNLPTSCKQLVSKM